MSKRPAVVVLALGAALCSASSPSLGTLEDIFGDTGNHFQAAIGLQVFEPRPSESAVPSFGMAIDDMVVEWKESTLVADETDCGTAAGQCAVLEVQSTRLFEGNGVIDVSLLEPFVDPGVNNDCLLDGDDTDTGYCANTLPITEGGRYSFPAINQCSTASAATECRACSAGSANAGDPCDTDGNCFGGPCSVSVACVANPRYDDDRDCDDDGTEDLVVRAFSEGELTGELVYVNQVGSGSEYRGQLTFSTVVDSPGILFLAQAGEDLPSVNVRYFDADDGTGARCANNFVAEDAGNVESGATVFIDTCKIAVVGTTLTDNGDGDGIADSTETVEIGFAVVNGCGFELNNCIARLSTNSPAVECLKTSTVLVGDLADTTEPAAVVDPFVFKVADVSRASPEDDLGADFNFSISCDEIDALSAAQSISVALDLNLSDGGQTPIPWIESFETGGLGKFETMNLDAGIVIDGNRPASVANADGWRCAYNDPDWVNGSAYGDDAALACYPSNSAAQSAATYFHQDGPGTSNVDEGRAFTGSFSMAYNLPAFTYLDWTTPISTVDAARTSAPINLGVDHPQLSFWHHVSLLDGRALGSVPFNITGDRGKVQLQLTAPDGTPEGGWINLEPFQNPYDSQASDNFFNCLFDPTDDGTSEDDFFDPTDPDRDDGPSSTCFPEFVFSCMGDTGFSGPFPGPICNAVTPPDPVMDVPSWGPGTWVESLIDLSEWKGRRARLRFLVTSVKVTSEVWENQFFENPDPRDDGWWIDDVAVDETLILPAGFVVDEHTVRTCSLSGTPCLGQCKLEQGTICTLGGGECTAMGDTCLAPCGVGEGSCTGPTPGCGDGCTTITPHVFVEPAGLDNPSSVTTPAPGQVVSFNGAAPVDPETPQAQPSFADACLGGALLYRFCEDGADDGDCDGAGDRLLRGWSDKPNISVAPEVSGSFTTEISCSTNRSCVGSHTVEIDVQCPAPGGGPGPNALTLAALRCSKGPDTCSWPGPTLDVRVSRGPLATLRVEDGGPFLGYDSSTTLAAANGFPLSQNDAWYLVRVQGAKNTKEAGFHCNSRTYRSGGAGELPEGYDYPPLDPEGSAYNGRDGEIVP